MSILVAVDFSKPSIKALSVAVQLCEQLHKELKVIYVAEMDAPNHTNDEVNDPVPIESKLLDAFSHQLEDFTRSIVVDKISCTTHVVFGEVAEQVNKAAKEMQVEMIVIGTHGRTGIEHLLMGSIAESVLQSALVPVLCVRKQT